MGEKELYAAARQDQTFLHGPTFHDMDSLKCGWMKVGKRLGNGIDRYVNVFENVLSRVQIFSDAPSCAPIGQNNSARGGRG
jgi:hypothetical protein